MFYSQYILAKKGPLGTIWIAAHLEKKLRKNQVNDTNISSSVDSILFPEVPIALRLSGHLLLGVVRIYSRKVNYLFHDCNDALFKLKNAFTSASTASVDLPPEAASAPFHTITLPETFEFDDMDVGDVVYKQDEVDHHVTTRDQITLEDIAEDDAYPGSQFEQDERFMETPHTLDLDNEKFLSTDIGPPELQEDVLPPMNMDETGPSTPDSGVVPDVEKLRSAPLTREGNEDFHAFDKEGGADAEPPVGTPAVLVEDAHTLLQSTPVSRPDVNSPSLQTPERSGSDDAPALGVVETPTRQTRKRKKMLDTKLTLSESYMKDMLHDSSDLRRVRRKVSPMEMLIFKKEILGKRMLSTPSVDGLCSPLQELYDRVFSSKRLKGAVANVTFADDTSARDTTAAQSPRTPKIPADIPDSVSTPTGKSPENLSEVPVLSPEPLRETHEPPPEIPEAAPVIPENSETVHSGDGVAVSPSEYHNRKLSGDPSFPARDVDTADVSHQDFPPPIDSSYLLSSNGSDVVGSQHEGWSERTRAIGQFLRATFEAAANRPVTVNALLTGKTRKEAARMFFETLVLRTNDYITVEQNSAYEDINIYSLPRLMKAVF